jgi:signal transduction histidine kinase
LTYSAEDARRAIVKVREGANLTGLWDPVRLEQLVGNLLGNAFKYSTAGTPVEIDLDADEDAAMLTVRDRGMGIAAEDLKHIFSRYQRAGNARERGIEGSGLGLYICKGIVDAHEGQIRATSPGPGKGTTMTVTLPRCGNQT